MNKKRVNHLFLLLLLAVVFATCLSEIREMEEEQAPLPPEIVATKAWYEAKIDGSSLYWRVGERGGMLEADWRNAFAGNDAYFRIIEVPLGGDQLFYRISPEVFERSESTGDKRYLTSIMRLLIRICEETNEKDAHVMSVSPDLVYLSKNLDNPLQNFTYLNHGEEFSGLVLFYDLTGTLVDGYQVTDGEFFRVRPPNQPQLRGSCVVIVHVIDFYITNGVITLFNSTQYISLEIYCHSDGSGGGFGGGNNGGMTGNDGPGMGGPGGGSGGSSSGLANVDMARLQATGICANAAGTRANPLRNMILAPPIRTDGSRNIAGATFGDTRRNDDGTIRRHNGIDLAGPVGTPIHAQFDGVVTGNPVTNQQNRIDGEIAPGTRPAGNMITINSTVNGQTVSFVYMHLREGTPIAINPATGRPWANGDPIRAGQVIGYIGITGSAFANVPHLHLETRINGVHVNPTQFLHATVSTTNTFISTPCD